MLSSPVVEWSTSDQRNTGMERQRYSFSHQQNEVVVRVFVASREWERCKNSLVGSSTAPYRRGKSEKCPVMEVMM